MSDLDPKLTFDSFVVGPANRLASAAARRAADSPGTSYNPLFLYSSPGLGKTHILMAIAHQSGRAREGRVEYMALEEYLDRLETSLQAGQRDGLHSDLDILLLDDVQFLTGQPEAQEMLLKTLDQLSAAGGQIVLASDRPPADIDGLDARLLSRFSGGLIVDLGPPEYETRVAIIRKKAEERGQTLEEGVAEAVAKAPFKNVRELGGVLNKIFAMQDLEDRRVSPERGSGSPDPAGRGGVAGRLRRVRLVPQRARHLRRGSGGEDRGALAQSDPRGQGIRRPAGVLRPAPASPIWPPRSPRAGRRSSSRTRPTCNASTTSTTSCSAWATRGQRLLRAS